MSLFVDVSRAPCVTLSLSLLVIGVQLYSSTSYKLNMLKTYWHEMRKFQFRNLNFLFVFDAQPRHGNAQYDGNNNAEP